MINNTKNYAYWLYLLNFPEYYDEAMECLKNYAECLVK